MSQRRPLRIGVVGSGGAGKSSLCNALLELRGEEVFPVSQNYFISETKRCIKERRNAWNRDITIVDSPGVFDSQELFDAIKEVDKLLSFCSDGFHAFLLVFRNDKYIKDEEIKVIQYLKEIMGDMFLTFTTVVFTFSDKIENNANEFQRRIEELRERNVRVDELLRLCNERKVMIDTSRQRDNARLRNQIQQLLEVVESNVSEKVYTDTMSQALRQRYQLSRDVVRDPLDILVFGEAGTGKSSLCNSLLDCDKFPVSKGVHASSVNTKETQYVMGKQTTVIDAATGVDKVESAANDKGFHAFLLVLRADDNFRLEEANAMTMRLLQIFDETEFLQAFVVVFTHLDAYRDENQFSQTLANARRQNKSLHQLLNMCSDRFVVDTRDRGRQDSLKRLRQKLNDLAAGRRVAGKTGFFAWFWAALRRLSGG